MSIAYSDSGIQLSSEVEHAMSDTSHSNEVHYYRQLYDQLSNQNS